MSCAYSYINFLVRRLDNDKAVGTFEIEMDDSIEVTKRDVKKFGQGWGDPDNPITDPDDFVWYTGIITICDGDKTGRQDSEFLGIWPDEGSGAETFDEDCESIFAKMAGVQNFEDNYYIEQVDDDNMWKELSEWLHSTDK